MRFGLRLLTLGAGLLSCASHASVVEEDPPALSEEQKALVAASTASKAVAEAKKATADAEKASAEASKAASEARSAAVQAKFGPLGSVENTGQVTAGSTGGKMEGTLLAAAATNIAGDRIAERLCLATVQLDGSADRCAVKEGRTPALTVAPSLPTTGSLRPVADVTGGDACQLLASFARASMAGGQPRGYVFLTEAAAQSLDVYESFMVYTASVGRQMCHALDRARRAEARNAALLALRPRAGGGTGNDGMSGGGFGDPVTAAATALDTVAKLFRSEYTINTFDLTSDDQLLLKAVMLSFRARRPDARVYAPEIFPLMASAAGNPVVDRLSTLDEVQLQVAEAATEQLALEARLRELGERVSDSDAPRVAAAADEQKAVVDALNAATNAYSALITAASSAQGDRAAVLPLALRQGRTAQLLGQGGTLVVTKMHTLAASTYSRKNFFTAFGDMPFFAAGGTVVSYAAMDGATGIVLDSAALPVSGGYRRVTKVPDLLGAPLLR